MNPVFSIVAPAVRGSYTIFCESLQQTPPKVASDGHDLAPVSFEIVFAGPNPPKEHMPDNFTYVKTNVKPAQCAEIAARYAVGEYLITAADDYSYSDNYLRKMHWYIKRFDMNRVIFLNRFQVGIGKNRPAHKRAIMEYCGFWDLPECPLTHPCFMVKREIWHELGGVDRRYETICYDSDLQLRCYERGMIPFIVPECLVSESDKRRQDAPRLTDRASAQSQFDLTTSFWIREDGSFSPHRLSEVQPFSDEDILIKDQ